MKPYVKPELFLEEFELSQSVAACGWDMNNQDRDTCQAEGDVENFDNPDEKLFNVAPCTITEVERYCYEVPTANDAFRIFRS